jgi:hypothetical protein
MAPQPLHRHARARRGHPRLSGLAPGQDVDGRDKPGHDGKAITLRRLRHRRGAVSLCQPSRRKAPPRPRHLQSQARPIRADLGGDDHQRRQCALVVRRNHRRSGPRGPARAIGGAGCEDRLHRAFANRTPRRTTRQGNGKGGGAEAEGIFGRWVRWGAHSRTHLARFAPRYAFRKFAACEQRRCRLARSVHAACHAAPDRNDIRKILNFGDGGGY